MKLKNIMKFSKFTLENNSEIESDVVNYLSSLNDNEINSDLNDLIKSHNIEDKKELIEDILLHISDKLKDDEFHAVEDELKKTFLKK